MTVWQRAAAAARAFFQSSSEVGPPPASAPAARPLPDPLRGAGRGVRPVQGRTSAPGLAVVPARPPVPRTSDFAWPPADDFTAMPTLAAQASAIEPVVSRERRRKRSDRRKADRRKKNLGSPYGSERRSGRDDRQGERRSNSDGQAGIGLSRDYFAQAEARVTTDDTGLGDDDLVRFRD